MNILAIFVLLSALAISACGAFFSIVGLKMLFVGGGISIIVMGTALEVGKLITATFLKQKWDEINLLMKAYLMIATLFLMGITSIGIYGYLSAGYTATAITVQGYEQQIESNNAKVIEIEKQNEFIKNSDYNSEEIKAVDINRKKFIEQKLQLIAQKNQQIENIRKGSTTNQDASVDISAAKQALEISKSSNDSDISKELEQIKLYNSRLEILDKEVQKWIDEGSSGGFFKKSGLEKARLVKEGQAKERGEIDSQIKSSQDRIEKLRQQYAYQVKEYNDRVSAIENRSKSQRGDIEANIKKIEKENEDIVASIDTYNKESDNKISSLNSKKDELIESGNKKILENQEVIKSLKAQNTELKEKIVHTDVGTFKFIANSFGIPLDKAVNYFIWSIMVVFDPLAVALVLAYNSLVGKPKRKEEEKAEEKEIVIKEVPVEVVKTVEIPKEIIKYIEVPKEVVKYITVPQETIRLDQIPEAIRNNFTFPFYQETTSSIVSQSLEITASQATESIQITGSLESTGSFEVTGSVEVSNSVEGIVEPTTRIIKPATPDQPLPPPPMVRKHEHFSRPMR